MKMNADGAAWRLLVITAKLPCYYEQSCAEESRECRRVRHAPREEMEAEKYSASWAKAVFNELSQRTTLGKVSGKPLYGIAKTAQQCGERIQSDFFSICTALFTYAGLIP
jgi:hypothetical protein